MDYGLAFLYGAVALAAFMLYRQGEGRMTRACFTLSSSCALGLLYVLMYQDDNTLLISLVIVIVDFVLTFLVSNGKFAKVVQHD